MEWRSGLEGNIAIPEAREDMRPLSVYDFRQILYLEIDATLIQQK